MPKRRRSLVDLRIQGEGGYPKSLKFGETSFMDGPQGCVFEVYSSEIKNLFVFNRDNTILCSLQARSNERSQANPGSLIKGVMAQLDMKIKAGFQSTINSDRKTEDLMVILRCPTFKNLNQIKSYDIKNFFLCFQFFAIL